MSSTYNIFIFQKNRQTQCLRWLSAFFAYPSVENGILQIKILRNFLYYTKKLLLFTGVRHLNK